jgi:uncharacterized protein
MNLHHLQRLGILMFPFLCLAPRLAHAASYAPLDCVKASTAAETTVCKTYALGQDEARLATLFGVLTSLVAMGQRSDLIDTQRQWISVRDACGGKVDCLSRAYETRINELSQALDTLAKRGPF